MFIVLQRKVHKVSDPGGVHVLQLVLFVGVDHAPLVDVPILSNKCPNPEISPVVWILTMVSASSPSSSAPLSCLCWLRLLLACCSGVAPVPVLTSGLGLLACRRRGRRVLILLHIFLRKSNIEPEHKRPLLRNADPTIERCSLAPDAIFTASGLFSDVSSAVPVTSHRCPVDVMNLSFEHGRLYLFLLSGLGRLCCATSSENVLAVLVSLLQLP